MLTNTEKYEASHGRKPRGRGCWAFEMAFTDGEGRYSTETVFANGTLAEARRLAWQQVRRTVSRAKTLVEAVGSVWHRSAPFRLRQDKRARRNGTKGEARKAWYARWRQERQACRFWGAK